MYNIPYLIAFCFICFFVLPLNSRTQSINSKKINHYQLFNETIVIFSLSIFLGFRGFIFTDYVSYYPFYSDIPSLFSNSFSIKYFETKDWEIGYLLYSLICKTLFQNYIIFQFVSTLIDLLLLRYIVNLYIPKKTHVMVYALFFAFYGLTIEVNLLRNSKAILFFLIAIKYINKSFIKYTLWCFLGILFHKWTVVYIPLYFLLGRKWNRKIILFFWLLGNFVCLFHIEYLRNIFLFLTSNISGNIFVDGIRYYLNSSKYSVSYSLGFGWFERSISFFIIFYYGKKLNSKKSSVNVFLNMSYIYFFIWLYFSELTIFIQRFTLLFVCGFWFSISYIYSKLSLKIKKYLLLYIFLIGLIKIFIGYNHIIFDYKLIFFDNFDLRKKIFLQNRDIF